MGYKFHRPAFSEGRVVYNSVFQPHQTGDELDRVVLIMVTEITIVWVEFPLLWRSQDLMVNSPCSQEWSAGGGSARRLTA